MAKVKRVKPWESRWRLQDEESSSKRQGGQGVVRQVVNLKTGIKGALKELKEHKKDERRKRMAIEATSLRTLDHPNISKLLDEDVHADKPFIVTEFIEGSTLEDYVDSKPLMLHDVIQFTEKLLDALSHAHAIGVFHRDIKPENIMLRGGCAADPVVIDFGISFNDEESLFSAATWTGQQLGNRFLHLPELQRGAREPRSDLTQTCGVILYALTDVRPISLLNENGEMPHQVEEVRQILTDSITTEGYRANLFRLFDRGFQAKLKDRWQTAEEILQAVRSLMNVEDESKPLSYDAIRQRVEENPDAQRALLTKSLHASFMQQSMWSPD